MIGLAVIEDNTSYLEALKLYIATVEDIQLVYTGSDLQDLENRLLAVHPDAILMDIDLGAQSGIDGVKMIKRILPSAGIIMLTVFEDEEKIVQSIQAGALGYLLKKDPPEKIVEAIRGISRGEGAINGAIARKIIDHYSQPVKSPLKIDDFNLTKREKEIFHLLMEGLSYKEMASRCFISIDTLNSHIRKLYTKLSVHSRAEIAARFR